MIESIHIVLVEDEPIIRQGLRYILEAQPDMKVVGEAGDGQAALEESIKTTPDVILMDIRLPKVDGIKATRQILEVLPATKVVLLTTFDIQEYVYDGIRAGAVGYILKDADTLALLDGIRTAHQGGIVYRSANSQQAVAQALQEGAEIARLGADTPFWIEPLTDREQDVLQQMAFGHTNAEIAAVLSLSEGTVKSHVHRILQKFNVDDRTQVVVMALRRHIVD